MENDQKMSENEYIKLTYIQKFKRRLLHPGGKVLFIFLITIPATNFLFYLASLWFFVVNQ